MLRARDVALAEDSEKGGGAFAVAAELRRPNPHDCARAIKSMLHVRLSQPPLAPIICELEFNGCGVDLTQISATR
jgi:hypothetical protein